MPIESALVALIPVAESLVKPFRDSHDPSAAIGVPAHVTILYPFRSPDALSAQVLTVLHELFQEVPGFAASFMDASDVLPSQNQPACWRPMMSRTTRRTA